MAFGRLGAGFGRLGAPLGGVGVQPFNYDFTTGSLPSGVTLSRTSAATYYNSSGIISTALANVARFDFNPTTLVRRGLLIEPAVANNCFPSVPTAGTAWSTFQANATYNNATSPDGTTTAGLWAATGTGGNNDFYIDDAGAGLSLPGTSLVTFSTFLKGGTSLQGVIEIGTISINSGFSANYNLSAGTLTGGVGIGTGTFVSSSIQALPNGWFRASITGTINNSATPVLYQSVAAQGVGANGQTSFQWGQQIELGSAPSSFVYTTQGTGVVTRAADSLSFTIPAGINHLAYTFDDNSTQGVTVSPGAYTVPTNLNRPWIKSIAGTAASLTALLFSGAQILFNGQALTFT